MKVPEEFATLVANVSPERMAAAMRTASVYAGSIAQLHLAEGVGTQAAAQAGADAGLWLMRVLLRAMTDPATPRGYADTT